MPPDERINEILQLGKVLWRKHALERILERGISRETVLGVLKLCDRIETYPDDKPYPSALYFGKIKAEAIHVVASIDESANALHIITVYEPDSNHFESDLRKRRASQ